MKAASKRTRPATKRKPAAKKPARKVATKKAAPARQVAKPRVKRAVQRRLIIRFSDPSDVDWLGAQSERMGLGDAKGPGAATYARMLIRAARECGGDPIDILRRQTLRPLPPGGSTQGQRTERAINPPVVAPDEPPQEPEGEPVDVDDLVNEVVSKVQDDRGPPPDDEAEHRGGGVRVFGARHTRRPIDWSGR